MKMPDTKPLPAAELLALADAAIEELQRPDTAPECEEDSALFKYAAARAASPVTLEEVMLIMGNRFESGQLTPEEEEEWERTTREHARRLAGEGGV